MAATAEGPVVMSFPSILRASGTNPYAHLLRAAKQPSETHPTTTVAKKRRRDENEGKRWIKRKENARFVHNPHIVPATREDYTLQHAQNRTTFPEPLPAYLPRTAKVPAGIPAVRDPISANAGRFSLSLKGMRKELRHSGVRTQFLVRAVEDEIVQWLQAGGTLLSPDGDSPGDFDFPGPVVRDQEAIREVSRTPLQLVWSIEEDAFVRYVVHCCARYHEIVSFSKEHAPSGKRLTYLLRPNVTRPDYTAPRALDTPPVTDLDYSSHPESEFVSDRDMDALDSDIEGPLSVISEGNNSPAPVLQTLASDDEWSIVGSDIEADVHLAASLESLSLAEGEEEEGDRTFRIEPRVRQPLGSKRSRVWDRRSASSPSRSPARRAATRRVRAIRMEPPKAVDRSKSFYGYLFS